MKIQQVERQTGIAAQTIRYYEREGLVIPQRDAGNSYRIYTAEDVERLNVIVFCRRLGISIPEIRAMLQEDCSFRQCVERAMLQAKKLEEEAAVQAGLCQAVLRELDRRPDLVPMRCAEEILRDRTTRKLYEQVLPPEQRKPPKNRYWALYLTAIPALLVGILVIMVITGAVRYRSCRNQMVTWILDPQAEITFTCDSRTVQSSYAQNLLENLLVKASPVTNYPWIGEETDVVTVTVVRKEGTATLKLWELKERVCIRLRLPETETAWTMLEYGSLMLYRQIRSGVLTDGT